MDITLCTTDKCSLKKFCLRSTAKPGRWQSYSCFVQDSEGKCIGFWPNNSKYEKKN